MLPPLKTPPHSLQDQQYHTVQWAQMTHVPLGEGQLALMYTSMYQLLSAVCSHRWPARHAVLRQSGTSLLLQVKQLAENPCGAC